MNHFDKLGGRKFILAVALVIMAFTLALTGKLTDSFTAIAVAGVGGFLGANAYVSGKALKNAATDSE